LHQVALAEHKAECEREDKALQAAEQSSSGASSQPHRDLAIKEGEKIKINIGGVRMTFFLLSCTMNVIS
jgi:hypothetical protein